MKRLRILAAFCLALLLAAQLGCAAGPKVEPLKPVAYKAQDAQGFWDQARAQLSRGEYAQARLNMARAVDADRSLAENTGFLKDYGRAASGIVAQEARQEGGEEK